MAQAHARDAAAAGQEPDRRRLVQDLDPVPRGARVQGLHQFLAAAPDVAGEPAPELESAVNAERLAAEPQLEAHALLAHPQPGLEAAPDQGLGEVGVAAVLGQPAHVIEILRLAVGAEIDVPEFGLVHVGDQPRQVLRPVIDDAKGAAGKGGVAGALLLGRDFEHQYPRAVLARRQGGAGRGVPGPDDDHVIVAAIHRVPLAAIASLRRDCFVAALIAMTTYIRLQSSAAVILPEPGHGRPGRSSE